MAVLDSKEWFVKSSQNFLKPDIDSQWQVKKVPKAFNNYCK